MSENPLELHELCLCYSGDRETTVVREASIDITPGSFLALVGESGSGKSTLARAVVTGESGLVERVSGDLRLFGRSASSLTPHEYSRLVATRVGYVPQDPALSLNPTKRVGKAISDSLRLRAVPGLDRSDPVRSVETLLRRVGFSDPAAVAGRYPHELSGGMKQRILIATAVAHRPDLIVADEPTSALDATVQREILELLDDVRAEVGAAVLLITHDIRLAADRADTAAVMHRGEIVEIGPAREVLLEPRSDYARHLVSRVPTRTAPVQEEQPAPLSDRPALTVTGLTKTFSGGRRVPAKDALKQVSFEVEAGTIHAVVGESGSGKSTLGRIVSGFELPTSGHVELDGEPLPPTLSWSRDWRRRTQLIHQHPRSALDPRQRVLDIVAEPLRNFGAGRTTKAQARDQAGALLEQVHLPTSTWKRKPGELSGGQAQRVAIARALAPDPTLLILDEAVSALDVSIQAEVLDLLVEIRAQRPITYLFISHDLGLVRSFAHTVGVFLHGVLVEQGNAAAVLSDPAEEYTRRLLRAVPGEALLVEEGASSP